MRTIPRMQGVHTVFRPDLGVASLDRLPWPRVKPQPSFRLTSLLLDLLGPAVALDPLDGKHHVGLLLVPSSPYFPNQGIWRQDLGDLPKQEAQ